MPGNASAAGPAPAHSVVVPLDRVHPEVLRERLRRLAAWYPELVGCQLWVRAVLGSHHQAVAQELGRGLAPGSELRLTLLCGGDSGSELVVVAARDTWSYARLRAVAGYLAEGGDPPVLPAYSADRFPAGDDGAAPGWGLAEPGGGTGLGVTELEADQLSVHDRTELVAATALVLARYAGAATVLLPMRELDRPTGTGWHRVAVDETAPVHQLLAQVGAPGAEGGAAPVLLLITGDATGYHPVLTVERPVTILATLTGRDPATLTCWYDRATVHPASAAQLLRQIAHVAGQLTVLDPAAVLTEVALVEPAEQRRLLDAGRTPAPAQRHDGSIPTLVRAVAARQPGRTAVTDGTTTLTYQALVAAAEQRARGLRGRGVRPGDLVGVCQERAADLVVSLLAVGMAGAAYLPLDPHNPADRLRGIAADAGARLVVTDVVTDLGPVLLAAPEELDRGTDSEPLPVVDAAATAYVIYTSGSTGRPKGVVVPHGNVAALIDAVRADGYDHTDVWTLFHASSFDFSVWEIWGCLATGGRLVVVPYLVTRSPEEFHGLLAREAVTVLSQTPSAFANLLDVDARVDRELALRTVVFGGEALDSRLLTRWFARHPYSTCRMVNMYGITETTVHVTARQLTPADAAAGTRSVGRALPGWSVSVRDSAGRVLPPGIAGEIYVGGAGLATGYLDRAELTAQRFPYDPDGTRWYRSGDRGRLRHDGDIEHLGRLDEQVKIRGYRIELGEIRAALLADPHLVAAVVGTDGEPSDPGGVRLVAYAVLRPDADPARIRHRLTLTLPDYMVPASITVLDALPLTPNGKLDTARLPAPVATVPRTADPRLMPGGDPAGDGAIAGAVLRAWQSVLPGARSDDDFFAAGGNSLLAVRLVAAIRAAGLPPVSVRELYVNRSAGALIHLLSARQPVAAG